MRLAENKKLFIDYEYTGEKKDVVEITIETAHGKAVLKVRPVGTHNTVDVTMTTFHTDDVATGLCISQVFRPHMKEVEVPPYKMRK